MQKKIDVINNPKHYSYLKKVNPIDVTEQFNFCKGNALKYIMRAQFKGAEEEDLRKAIFYIKREISNLKKYGKKKNDNIRK